MKRNNVLDAYIDGATLYEIRERFGVSPATVRRWAQLDGVPVRPPGNKGRRKGAAPVARPECGYNAGVRLHRANGERTCDACAAFQAARQRVYDRTRRVLYATR